MRLTVSATSVALFVTLATSGVCAAIVKQTGAHHLAVFRNSNLVADAQARTEEAVREHVHYRGPMPLIRVSTPVSVNAQQLSALGFKSLRNGNGGVLVQTDVLDSAGNWRYYYVYDPQTHFVRYEMERLVVAGARPSGIRRTTH